MRRGTLWLLWGIEGCAVCGSGDAGRAGKHVGVQAEMRRPFLVAPAVGVGDFLGTPEGGHFALHGHAIQRKPIVAVKRLPTLPSPHVGRPRAGAFRSQMGVTLVATGKAPHETESEIGMPCQSGLPRFSAEDAA